MSKNNLAGGHNALMNGRNAGPAVSRNVNEDNTMAEHHDLDPYPVPEDKGALFINEPWIVDKTYMYMERWSKEPEDEPDNVRVYIPMDLNRRSIMRRLNLVIRQYGGVTEENEVRYRAEVDMIIYQLQIYDQVRFVRNLPGRGSHSEDGIALAQEIIERLEEIDEGDAELFPMVVIEELRLEYLALD